MSWDNYFSEMCILVASKSKDRSTQVGCVIVDENNLIQTTGYNGFVRGANDERPDWHERPKKYEVTIHAEGNAVATAANKGISLHGCTAYISLPPCAKCTGLLIQAGITKIKVLPVPKNWKSFSTWDLNFQIAEEILDEAGIPLIFLRRRTNDSTSRTELPIRRLGLYRKIAAKKVWLPRSNRNPKRA